MLEDKRVKARNMYHDETLKGRIESEYWDIPSMVIEVKMSTVLASSLSYTLQLTQNKIGPTSTIFFWVIRCLKNIQITDFSNPRYSIEIIIMKLILIDGCYITCGPELSVILYVND